MVRHPAIARSLNFLRRHWQQPIRVGDLAKISALSRRGFLKAFLKHVGGHPSDELERIRMQHAENLLTRTSYSAQKISALCGYRSTNSFWVAFRRFHDQSPQHYRQQNALTLTTGQRNIQPSRRARHRLPRRTAPKFQPALPNIRNAWS